MKRRLHRAVEDQAGIALDLGDIVAVVMDAVAVEGQRRIAKQQHGIGHVASRDALRDRRRRRRFGGCGLRRARDVAIDDVLALADRDAARRRHVVLDRDEAQRAGASRSSCVTSAMRETRVDSSPTRKGSMNSSSPPAHIRRGSGTGGRKPPRVGWPSGPSIDIGNTGCARHQCVVNGAASPGLRLADLLEQRRAQAFHQLRGDDVGGFGRCGRSIARR